MRSCLPLLMACSTLLFPSDFELGTPPAFNAAQAKNETKRGIKHSAKRLAAAIETTTGEVGRDVSSTLSKAAGWVKRTARTIKNDVKDAAKTASQKLKSIFGN
jgi:gas vesicle protein